MHLSEEHLAMVVHEERGRLPAGAASHLASCAECATRVASLRRADREVGDLLRSMDHPAPAVRSADFVRAPAKSNRRAAAIIAATALAAAAAAAAIPASPLHKALVRVMTRDALSTPVPAVIAPASAQKSGIAFTPTGSVEVRFVNPQLGDRVRVVFTDAEDLSATATGDAGFSLHGAGLDIDDKGIPMSFALEIPRGLSSVRVLANEKLIFASQGGTVLGSAVPDARGGYVLDPTKSAGIRQQP